jgi:hypothetical protein
MPRATISFNLPEETEEFKDAVNVQDYKSIIHEVEQEVFRPARKHGYSNREIEKLINAINDLIDRTQFDDLSMHPRDSNGYLNATDLIGLLEQKFYNIKREILEKE